MKVYCITHERMFTVLDEFHGHMRLELLPEQVFFCYGTFTFSAPPELEEDWELNVSIPSPAELVEMDAVASELLTEFALV